MVINGIELDFDLYDVDNPDMRNRYYEELNKMRNAKQNAPKGSQLEEDRYCCKVIKKMFDNVFGEGTGEAVCGTKNSLLICLKAYKELAYEAVRQVNEYKEIMQNLEEI